MVRVIGIGEWAVSENKNEIIKTFALGSCVAVTVYCPANHIAGMAHIALPAGGPSAERLSRKAYYATTAVPLMLGEIFVRGCIKGQLIIKLFGGANSQKANDRFKIGPQNIKAVQTILKDLGLSCDARETGGLCSRTVQIEAATGTTSVVQHRMII